MTADLKPADIATHACKNQRADCAEGSVPSRQFRFRIRVIESFRVAVSFAPAITAPCGSVTVPLIAPFAPEKKTCDAMLPALSTPGVMISPVNCEKVATSKSSAVPSLPSSPLLRRSIELNLLSDRDNLRSHYSLVGRRSNGLNYRPVGILVKRFVSRVKAMAPRIGKALGSMPVLAKACCNWRIVVEEDYWPV